MELKKRKIKYSAIFVICWFVFLVFLVDGVLKFQTLVDYFGSYALVEVALLLLVILPTLAIYKFTKEEWQHFYCTIGDSPSIGEEWCRVGKVTLGTDTLSRACSRSRRVLIS